MFLLFKTFIYFLVNIGTLSSFFIFVYLSLLIDTSILFYIFISCINICNLLIIKYRLKWINECIQLDTIISPTNTSFLILYFFYFTFVFSLLYTEPSFRHPLLIGFLFIEGITFLTINIYSYFHLNNRIAKKYTLIKVKLKNVDLSFDTHIEDLVCSICLEEIDKTAIEGINIKITECNHLFHTECINKWIDTSTSPQSENEIKCPNCRTNLV